MSIPLRAVPWIPDGCRRLILILGGRPAKNGPGWIVNVIRSATANSEAGKC